MRLNDINKSVHKNRKRSRIGRGPGSGHGKTSGRGHKGQGQLAGWMLLQFLRVDEVQLFDGFQNGALTTVMAE